MNVGVHVSIQIIVFYRYIPGMGLQDHMITHMDFPGGSVVKNLPASTGDIGEVGWEDPLEEKMATHSSILAWKIPWTEAPGELQSMGLQRTGHS